MSRNKIIPYNPKLKEYARQLRKNSTLAQVLLWQKIQKRAFGVQFRRQVPLLDYIVDFYCHELKLAIEVDGNSHEFKYEYDSERQGVLEKEGVRFLQFSDNEIKQNMFSISLVIEQTVEELVAFKNTPESPSQGGNAKKVSFGRPYNLPKQQRLKSKKVIERLFVEGKPINAFPLKLIYLKTLLPEDVPFQVAVIAPKKNFKAAVKRNRIKRLLREAYRLNKRLIFNNTEGQYALVILYLGKEMPSFLQIETKTKIVLSKLLKQISNEQA